MFDQSFNILVGFAPARNQTCREEIRRRLAQTILDSFEEGEIDPVKLRRKALMSVALAYVETTGVH
jgi:hypothetical protein